MTEAMEEEATELVVLVDLVVEVCRATGLGCGDLQRVLTNSATEAKETPSELEVLVDLTEDAPDALT